MNLLLLLKSSGDIYAVAEPQARQPDLLPVKDTFFGRLKFKIQQGYQQLREKFDYQERVCSELRHAEELIVIYPASMGAPEAEKKFREYLKLRYSKHTRWLWIDGALALLGSLLTPIPGPNVFFLYPAVRTLGHYLARKGAGHAFTLQNLSFAEESLLDQVQRCLNQLDAVDSAVSELENRYRVADLKTHLGYLNKDESRP